MASGFGNQPKILRGAFVEFGLSLPPCIVVFQFNPDTITRTRTATVQSPPTPRTNSGQNMDMVRKIQESSLFKDMRSGQTIVVNPETFAFDIRLDATDKLNEGDGLTENFGVTPQIATLERMMLPKNQSLLGGAIGALLGGSTQSFSFCDDAKNPPIILFVWGRKKVMPVNITNMTIHEQEFSADLNVTRATITVALQVIEGPNAPYLYSRGMGEAMSLLNLANIGDLASTFIPT
jgi:hypothetical protein